MRVLVLWANREQPNLGVRALASGAESLLKRAFGEGCDVRFHGTGAADAQGNDGPLNIGHLGPLLKNRITQPDTLRSWLGGFDLVLDMRGGDSFTDIYSVKRLVKNSALPLMCRAQGLPVVLGPQTIGPFETRSGRAIAWIILKAADLVMTRDPYSAEAARRLGRAVDLVTTDVVFALNRPETSQDYDVLVNPSGLLWNPNPHVDHLRYRSLLEEVIGALVTRGRSVSLLPHVLPAEKATPDDDTHGVEGLLKSFPGLPVTAPQDLMDARRKLGGAQLVIGSRMHACLNALSMGTPAIPLAYSRKFKPLLKQVGWPHNVDLRDPDTTPDAVLSMVDREDKLRQEIREVQQEADRRVQEAVDMLAERYSSRVR